MAFIERTDPVEVDKQNRVLRFGNPSIKVGAWPLAVTALYIVKRPIEPLPEGRLSWEKNVLPSLLNDGKDVYAFEAKGYFIDIGVPEDYEKSQMEIPQFINSLSS